MAEEKDQATMDTEQAHIDAGHPDGGSGGRPPGQQSGGTDAGAAGGRIVPQLVPTPGLPPRQAVRRRTDRVMSIMHTLPPAARQAILDSFTPTERARYEAGIRAGR
jgi:phospholipid/cholesterol/gamma-HCH transport system ATP-binding protein